MGFFYGIKYILSRQSAENLFPNILLGANIKAPSPHLFLSQNHVEKQVFGIWLSKFRFHSISQAHKQYSLLDTIFHYTF